MIRVFFNHALIVAVTLLFLQGCAWDKTFLFGNGGDGVKDSICFQNEIQPIINSNCAMSGCHDAITHEEGYDFSGYFGLMDIVKPGSPDKSKLMEVITAGEELMPPSPTPPLSSDQIALIQQWILEGAGYNIDCGVTIPCDTSAVTYSGTIAPMIQTNCLGCHSSQGTGGGILLTSYFQVVDEVNNGNFLCAVNHESGCNPMPQNAVQLSSCDLARIDIWVREGTPNN